jgi:hypothetical protein
MTMTKPCVYHYLFTHIPNYESEEKARKAAEDLVFRLKTDLRLQEDETQRLRSVSPDVTLLSCHVDEETETYLSQLLSNDLIATILTYNQTDTREEPLAFLERKRTARFSDTSEQIGETSVFFVQAEPDVEPVKQIVEVIGETPVIEPFPCCQFEWGALYALRQSASLQDARQTARYVLLVPKEDNLGKGDRFLSYSFPILESIWHKLLFEEQEARTFKVKNLRHEQEITRLLGKITSALNEPDQHFSFEADLRHVDTHQAALYHRLAETNALLLTLDINLENFEHTLKTLACAKDTLFEPLLPKFRFLRQQIEYDLKYITFLLPGLEKREELLRLKIEWQRKEAEERSNRIKTFTNTLIFSFGVAFGIGQVLSDFDLAIKFWAMLLGGSISFALHHVVGITHVKNLWEASTWPKKIAEQFHK